MKQHWLILALIPACAIAQEPAAAPAPAEASTSAAAPPGPEAGLQQCRQLTDTALRLVCYDAIALPDAAPAAAATPAAPANPDELHTRLVGKFDGWKHNMLLRLENGTVWKVTSDEGGYASGIPDNPAVTLSRSASGAWWLQIEGVKRNIKVKRVS